MGGSEYYVSEPGGEAKGPLSAETIRKMRSCGDLSAQYVIWCEGMTEAVPVDVFLASQVGGAGGWDIVSAFRSCLKRYAKFSGRASRSEYWRFQFGVFLVVFVGSLLAYVPGVPGVDLLLGLVMLALFLPALSVLVRRLHDTGFSGWWVLLYGVPYVGGLVLLIFTLMPSVSHANVYGFEPAGPEK